MIRVAEDSDVRVVSDEYHLAVLFDVAQCTH